MALHTSPTSSSGISKSGKPWPKLIALCCAASTLITVKMVVPTSGSLERIIRSCKFRFYFLRQTFIHQVVGVVHPLQQGFVCGCSIHNYRVPVFFVHVVT